MFANHAKRIDRLRRSMTEEGLDGLVLSDATSAAYIAGLYFSGGVGFRCFIIIPVEGQQEVTLVCSPMDVERVKPETWIRDIRATEEGEEGYDPNGTLSKVLREKGLAKSKLGIDRASVSTNTFIELEKRLPGVTFIDATKILLDNMVVKDDEELALLRKASRIADIGMEACLDTIKPGMTECDIAGEAELAMRRAGAEGFWSPTQVGTGYKKVPWDRYVEAFPTERKVKRGDIVKVDLQPMYKLYGGDFMVTGVMGRPSPEFAKIGEIVVDVGHEMVEAIRPGMRVNEFCNFYQKRMAKTGYEKYIFDNCAHGGGIQIGLRMPPWFTPQNSSQLKENTVVHMYPAIYKPGVGAMIVEFVTVVRKPKTEVLNKFPLDLSRL